MPSMVAPIDCAASSTMARSWRAASSRSSRMRAGWPKMWVTTIPRVRGVRRSATEAGSSP
jgi:hypothetical protein